MLSIGNDIVDFNFIDRQRTGSFQFYSKILSKAEQDHHHTLPADTVSFTNYVWLLWSAKEAIYKFLKRHQPGSIFSPTKISLEPKFSRLQDFQNGFPLIDFRKFSNSENPDQDIFCRSILTENYIHTIATASESEPVISDIRQIDSSDHADQSAAVRALLLNKLQATAPGATISFSKADAGYPVILNNGADTGLVASFAHHGHYVAYALHGA